MSASDSLSISAVLPAFEEAEHLRQTVSTLKSALEKETATWEILLVASAKARDGTPELARKLADENEHITFVEQAATDPGYGRAVALGIREAKNGWLLLTDSDGQFDFDDLPRLAARARGADAVLGYRARRADALARRLAGTLYSMTVRFTLGVRARDVDCAFKLVRRELLSASPLVSRTGAINAELLARVFRAGGRIEEVPVTHRARAGGSSRFERRAGAVGTIPDPAEAWAIASEVGALAIARVVAPSKR